MCNNTLSLFVTTIMFFSSCASATKYQSNESVSTKINPYTTKKKELVQMEDSFFVKIKPIIDTKKFLDLHKLLLEKEYDNQVLLVKPSKPTNDLLKVIEAFKNDPSVIYAYPNVRHKAKIR